MFVMSETMFIFAPCFSFICAQSYEIIYKIGNKPISFTINKIGNMRYTVRLKGEKQGTFCYQVAMNMAYDLACSMLDIEDFEEDMITINGRPYSYYFG